MTRRASRVAALAVVVVTAMVAFVVLRPVSRDDRIGGDEGVEYRRLTVGGLSYLFADVDLTRADLVQCWRRPADGKRYETFESVRVERAGRGERLLFATNGGIFEADRTPTGLYVEDGIEQVALNVRDGVGNFYLKPNGVFLIGLGGAAVVETSRYQATRPPARLALQSGPMLVDGGRIHPRFDRRSNNRRVRSAVGVASPTRVRFVLSEQPVTFYELATLFRDRLGCQDALYLDGEISRFYAPSAGLTDADGHFAGILAVVPKGPAAMPAGSRPTP